MSKILPGITHAVVRTPKKEDSQAMGIFAYVDLCFGPGDESCIRNVSFKKASVGLEYEANVPRSMSIVDGKKVYQKLVTGDAETMVVLVASKALDKVRAEKGLKYGRSYRVFSTSIEEIS